MAHDKADYTLLWRQLSHYPEQYLSASALPLLLQSPPSRPPVRLNLDHLAANNTLDLLANTPDVELFTHLRDVFYDSDLEKNETVNTAVDQKETKEKRWARWLRKWLGLVTRQIYQSDDTNLDTTDHTHNGTGTSKNNNAAEISAAMRLASPKYVPREWMLVECYNKANNGDYSTFHSLQNVLSDPYSEQPEIELLYYRKAPQTVYSFNQGLGVAGTAYMT